ncbi:hypothetical protein GcM1_226083 [Golovinomyces cichoracearum]|uniref:Uncharacterized protein n=1 Tax=Golovinomyces cichoracearum TaxID=62708 RepID=A0A420IPZ9_9PEZI|nr:hypothetical protein GcM1_226083 [Golovinomyces cichoracearum]
MLSVTIVRCYEYVNEDEDESYGKAILRIAILFATIYFPGVSFEEDTTKSNNPEGMRLGMKGKWTHNLLLITRALTCQT